MTENMDLAKSSSEQPNGRRRFDNSKLEFAYEMLTARYLSHDQMLWQTPALALTAQSFLMTIALGKDARPWQAAASSFLGAVLMIMSMHLLGRHRFLELIEKAKLMEMEEDLGIEPLSTQSWAWNYETPPSLGRAYRRHQYARTSPTYRRVFSYPSYKLWQIGLAPFCLVDVVIFVYVLAAMTVSAT